MLGVKGKRVPRTLFKECFNLRVFLLTTASKHLRTQLEACSVLDIWNLMYHVAIVKQAETLTMARESALSILPSRVIFQMMSPPDYKF